MDFFATCCIAFNFYSCTIGQINYIVEVVYITYVNY